MGRLPTAQGLPGRSDSGADGSRPPTSAAIGGRDLGTRAATAERGGQTLLPRDSRTCEHPAWRSSLTVVPSTGASWTGSNGGRRTRIARSASARTGLGPAREGLRAGGELTARGEGRPFGRRRTAQRPHWRPRRGPPAQAEPAPRARRQREGARVHDRPTRSRSPPGPRRHLKPR